MNASAFFCEYVNAFMNDGTPPAFVPKGIVIITIRISTNDRHLQLLWNEETDKNYRQNHNYNSFNPFQHKSNKFEVINYKRIIKLVYLIVF